MDLQAAASLARTLILEHTPPTLCVGFQWHNRTSALGTYIVTRDPAGLWETHTILLSRPMTEVCDEATVRNTILHECAHARAGIRAGHGPLWARECNLLGIEPKACGGMIGYDLPIPRTGVVAVCRVCGFKHWRPRKPTRARACAKCVTLSQDFAARTLVWERQRR